jgi:signal transduction histidine kinase
LGAGGAVIYGSARGALFQQFDDGLRGKAVAMAALTKLEGKKIEFEFTENLSTSLSTTNVVEFYQLSLVGGATLRRSRSLGQGELPAQFGTAQQPCFFDLRLPTGRQGRAIGLRFVPSHEHHDQALKPATEEADPELGLVVAADRTRLDQALASLRLVVLVAGALTLLATVGVVALVLRRCLAPLDHLARQAASIDAHSLQTRLPAEGLPAELLPISHCLNGLLARLERAFEDISQYAAKVTHELRTPLSILRLKVEQADGRLAPEMAEELQTQIHHLAHVVDQSLLLARAEQGRLPWNSSVFDLQDLLTDLTEDFAMLAREGGRAVRIEAARPGWIKADPRYVRQMVHALLSNALKHGQGDVSVRLRAGPRRCDLVVLNSLGRAPGHNEPTLGLGLRVLTGLLRLDETIRYRARAGRRFYVARLSFESAPAPEAHWLTAGAHRE